MLVILGNSAQLNPFLLQKGFFFPLKTYHFKNALQSGDLSRKRRLAVLNRRFLRLLYGVGSSLSRARRVDAIHLAGSDISKCAFSYQRRYRFVFSHYCLLGLKTSQKCTVWTQIFFLENSFMQKSLRVRGATVKFRKPRGLYFSKVLFERFIFGGAYVQRGLSMEGNCVSKSIGLAL